MRRAANQDSLTVRLCSDEEEWQRCGHLFVVADGMGGHSVGDLASRITIETLPQAYFRVEADSVADRMRQAVMAANHAVHERGRQNPEFSDMGTTCSALSLSATGLVIGHIGDSRIYRVRHGQIQQLTFDHSLQWEMIRLGRATAATVDLFHPRNVITRCIGPDINVKVDLEGPFSVQSGDRLVLCSDGLSNHVSDSEIGQVAGALAPPDAVRLLVNLANCRGGSDNSTVMVVDIDQYPQIPGDVLDSELSISGDTQPSISLTPRSGGAANRFMHALSVVGLILGVLLLSLQKISGAVALLTFAAVLQLIRFRWNRQPHRLQIPENPGGDTQGDFTLAAGVESRSAAPTEIADRPPYRVAVAILTDTLLDQLAEIQGELVQAARDSGWGVDFEELTQLSRSSVAAQQARRLDKALQSRARSIDLLMKELYARARAGNA